MTLKTVRAPVTLLAFASCIVIGYQALAQRAVAPAAPVVASVRIESLFDGLNQRAEAKVEIRSLEKELEDEKARREAALAQLEAKLEETVAEARRREIGDQITLERFKFKFWYQEASLELEVEKGLRMQNLYKSIREAVAALAAAEGYDMVIMDDQIDELTFERDARVPVQMQLLQQITSSKILYLNAAIDITEDLIQRMNNARR